MDLNTWILSFFNMTANSFNFAIWIHVWAYYGENWVEDTFWPKVWLSWQKGADQHLTILEWKKKLSLYFCLIVMEWNEFWLEGKIRKNTLTLQCKDQHLLGGRGDAYMRLIEQKLSAESRVISTAGNLGAGSQKKLGVENWVKNQRRWWRLQNSWESFQAAAPNRVTMPWALRSQSGPAGGPLDPINTV